MNKRVQNQTICSTLVFLKMSSVRCTRGRRRVRCRRPFWTLRFYPEGIRVGPSGKFYISDEYGPYVSEFDRQGNLVRRSKFRRNSLSRIRAPTRTSNCTGNAPDDRPIAGWKARDQPRRHNTVRNHAKRAPAGRGLTPGRRPRGLNNRILKVDLVGRDPGVRLRARGGYPRPGRQRNPRHQRPRISGRRARQPIESRRIPQAPTRKTIYKIDIEGATDVSDLACLPARCPPTSSRFRNLCLLICSTPTSACRITTAGIAEKIEGLAWGADLATEDVCCTWSATTIWCRRTRRRSMRSPSTRTSSRVRSTTSHSSCLVRCSHRGRSSRSSTGESRERATSAGCARP